MFEVDLSEKGSNVRYHQERARAFREIICKIVQVFYMYFMYMVDMHLELYL